MIAGAIAITVVRTIAGDEFAFARIVAPYRLDLVRVAFVICGAEGLADDAVQGVLVDRVAEARRRSVTQPTVWLRPGLAVTLRIELRGRRGPPLGDALRR